MTSRLAGLTGATLETAPSVCRDCVWWQTRGNREPEKRKWIERAEEEWGAWGTVYRDDDGRVLGSMQYGPASLFPRAADLPAGPPSDDAVLVTCAYLLTDTQPWVEQSLFLAAIGEARDKGARALEAFAYRYREGTPAAERFLVHRTVFPRDFLADFGFRTLRSSGRIELARLDLGGLQPVEEGAREKVLSVVREAFAPAPAPGAAGRRLGSPLAEVARKRRADEQLGDLDRVERRALAQVVADEEEREPVLRRGSARTRPTITSSTPMACPWPGSSRAASQAPPRGCARPPPARAARSVSIHTDSAWPTTTGTLTQLALKGRSGSSRILRVSSRSLTSSSNSTPSNSQSMRSWWSSGSSARRSSIASEPAPETDW